LFRKKKLKKGKGELLASWKKRTWKKQDEYLFSIKQKELRLAAHILHV
jgi:hypothetical protein